jgi:hypothetical protein
MWVFHYLKCLCYFFLKMYPCRVFVEVWHSPHQLKCSPLLWSYGGSLVSLHCQFHDFLARRVHSFIVTFLNPLQIYLGFVLLCATSGDQPTNWWKNELILWKLSFIWMKIMNDIVCDKHREMFNLDCWNHNF